MIKKLQDRYSCDLDLSDTVGQIFEGVTKQEELAIQVVQAALDREVSIPVTSNLRPQAVHRRHFEIVHTEGNKRRRIGAGLTYLAESLDPDQAVSSTERDGPPLQADLQTAPDLPGAQEELEMSETPNSSPPPGSRGGSEELGQPFEPELSGEPQVSDVSDSSGESDEPNDSEGSESEEERDVDDEVRAQLLRELQAGIDDAAEREVTTQQSNDAVLLEDSQSQGKRTFQINFAAPN